MEEMYRHMRGNAALRAIVVVDLINTLKKGFERGRIARTQLGEKATMATRQFQFGFADLSRRGDAKDFIRSEGVEGTNFLNNRVRMERLETLTIVCVGKNPID